MTVGGGSISDHVMPTPAGMLCSSNSLTITETESRLPQVVSTTLLVHLDFRIPDKIKQTMWNNEYIDLVILLNPQDNVNYTLSIGALADNPTICLSQQNRALPF